MPPTIQSGDRNDRDNRRKSRTLGPGKSDIVSRVKYGNTLPDIPFDPKFITYPFEANRFVQYNATSLERNYKHELLAEHDLGVTIDLINPDTYKIDPMCMLDPADEKLLEEDIATPGDSKRSRQHTKSVSWLRKTEYISSEYNRSVHSRDKAETKVAYNMKKQFTEEDLYKDRDNQISAIEKTFDDAKTPIMQHYSKPHVTPVEIMPLLPDFDMWIHPCAQVIFDDNPAAKDKTSHEAIEEMSQAMIRGMVDEDGEQFVGYFLPTEETTRKRKRDFAEGIQYADEEEYEYKLAKEYNWNVKNKASQGYEENYFMVFRKGEGVFYDELETRVRLSKRRALNKEAVTMTNSTLVVKNRPLNEQEVALQEARLSQLDNALPEDEEEDEEEEEEEETKVKDEDAEVDMETEEQQQEEAGSGDERGSGDEEAHGSDRAGSGSERAESGQESGAEEGAGSGAESGAESDAGSRAGSDAGSRAGSVTGSGAGSVTGSGAGSDAGSRAGSVAGSDAGSDAGSLAGSIAGSDVGSDAGSRAGSRAGSVAGSDVGSDAGSRAGSVAGSDVGSDAGSRAGSGAESGAEDQDESREVESGAESDAERQAGSGDESGGAGSGVESGPGSPAGSGAENEAGSGVESGAEEQRGSGAEEHESGSEREEAGSENEEDAQDGEDRNRREDEEAIFGSDASGDDSD